MNCSHGSDRCQLSSVRTYDSREGTILGHLFVARDIPVDALAITEGSLLIVQPAEIDEIAPRLAPTTRLALKVYLNTCPKS